ncbi:MAG: tyrosine--tRNA ligase [Helicobacter sp.]|nr:tyrosine--tRNA ligase [Helicobacter sp.]
MHIETIMQEITRGVSEIIGLEQIQFLIERHQKHGTTFLLKAGFDPTAPDLHLGHTVVLQKMATLQKYGAKVVFLIGDFTATIGDPSGKTQTRKPLSREEVLQNAKTYEQQVFKILDPSKTEVRFNSEWLAKLRLEDVLGLCAKFSVARMLERDDFEKRMRANAPISIVEFMYPLMQGYDSVALRCDIEFGGTDQKFNLLMGRHLQRSYGLQVGQQEQAVLMMPLLEGLDGVQKMSKSLGNYIALTDSAKEMYAKIMSISDSLMWRYYELLSTVALGEIESMQAKVESGALHPKSAKESLALEITARYHSKSEAQEAQAEFARIFAQNQIPQDMPVLESKGALWICKALVDGKLVSSTSQARREIAAGAVRINQQKELDINKQLDVGDYILQVGKRKFLHVLIQ